MDNDIVAPRMPQMTPESKRSLLSSSALLAGAMVLAGAGNYLLNLALARMLDRGEFGDASLMVSWMLALMLVAAGFQLVAVRLAAASTDPTEVDWIRSQLLRRALAVGATLGLAMAAGSSTLQAWFHTGSAMPFVVLGIGIPMYLGLAVDRGLRQARSGFGRLAASYVVEASTRIAVGLGLVVLGWGVTGATWGLTVSFAASWLIVWRPIRSSGSHHRRSSVPFWRLVGPVGVLLAGQVIISNGDVLIAKLFYTPDDAGAYISVAIVGRASFVLSTAIVQVVFPAAARQRDDETGFLRLGIGLVGALGVTSAGILFLAGPRVAETLFGPEYVGSASLLGPYALAAALFAVANLIATVDMARQRLTSTWVVLAGAIAQTAILGSVASSPASMVWLQVAVMTGLLLAVITARWAETRMPIRDLRQGALKLDAMLTRP